ncbi:hypothetical protein VTK26DRAFT_7951 [Humicola hyalothermophila]
MLRHGLTLLLTVLNTPNHDDLVDLVRDSILSGLEDFGDSWDPDSDWLDDAVWRDNQYRRREQWYTDADAAQDRREKTPFEGDRADAPPLAWVRFWKGEFSNYFGSLVPGTYRRWGYVMWDAERLDGPGAAAYMEREDWWEAQGWDPREEDYMEDSDR